MIEPHGPILETHRCPWCGQYNEMTKSQQSCWNCGALNYTQMERRVIERLTGRDPSIHYKVEAIGGKYGKWN